MRTRALAVALILVSTLVGCSTIVCKYWFNKGNQLFKDNKYEKAIAMYDKAIAAKPDFLLAHFYRGSAYYTLYKPGVDDQKNKKRAEEAIASFTRALEIDPAHTDSLLSLADLYDKLGDMARAEKCYMQLRGQSPDDPVGHYKLAEFYSKHDKAEQAVKIYEENIARNPNDPERYLYLARFYGDQNPPLFDKAIEQHQKTVPLYQGDRDKLKQAYYSIGVVCWAKSFRSPDLPPEERMATVKLGYEVIEKAMELDPDYPEPVIYKNLLMREEAKLPGTSDARKKELIAEAETYKNQYLALKKRQKEVEAAKAAEAAASGG